MKRTIAVFDFDGTLTTRDTLIEFIRFCKGTGRTLLGFLLFSPLMVLMKLKLYDNGKCKEHVFSWFFKGMAYVDFAKQGRCFAERAKGFARKETHEVLAKHLELGDTVYVISASIVEWVEPCLIPPKPSVRGDVCPPLTNTDDEINIGNGVKVLGTTVEVDSYGRLTGRFSSPNCYGAEKVRRLLMEEPDRDSYTLIAYGDSNGDNEMFALADKHIKV